MMTFRERLGKPSAAIQAMIDGLEDMEQEEGARVDMGTYLAADSEGGCVACAATAAAVKATGAEWTDLQARAFYAGVTSQFGVLATVMQVDQGDLVYFETSVNAFRLGHPCYLLKYFGVSGDAVSPELWGSGVTWRMDTDNWREELPKIERYKDALIAVGL